MDSSESELGILDLIQVFVETLDKCFENVCELDLIFHVDKVKQYCSFYFEYQLKVTQHYYFLSYVLSIYGATSQENLDTILSKQKQRMPIMLGMKKTESVKHNHIVFARFKILAVYTQYNSEPFQYVKERKNITLITYLKLTIPTIPVLRPS